MDFYRWHGHSGRRSRYQRTHSSCCGVRTCTHPKARNLRRSTHLHHRTILPISLMGTIDRCTRGLEILWCAMRCLGCCWTHPDCLLLLPTTKSQLARLVEDGSLQADRFRGRFPQHLWDVVVCGCAAVGRVPGKLS